MCIRFCKLEGVNTLECITRFPLGISSCKLRLEIDFFGFSNYLASTLNCFATRSLSGGLFRADATSLLKLLVCLIIAIITMGSLRIGSESLAEYINLQTTGWFAGQSHGENTTKSNIVVRYKIAA